MKAVSMADVCSKNNTQNRQHAVLLWDMAGTLIPFDPYSGAPRALPECDEFLPELARDFRMVVTTGDGHDSARGLLAGFGLVNHFECIYGDLFSPVGKPYGEILRHLGGRPEWSLSIGDRMSADVASDTDQVVTLLINQGDDVATAGLVFLIISTLKRHAQDFPAAFVAWRETLEPAPEAMGPSYGGEIVEAHRTSKGLSCLLLTYRHPVLDGDRFIIQI
jgi:hypothetical protein